jgi:hypothetical protein
MNKKQKEALVLALAEKGESYREITKKAGVSPNTIKAVLNRAGLDESTSISSRAFELFSEEKTPLQAAITLNLEAGQAIQYHQQYYMLLGCTEFTKVYPQIRDNPWPYVNLVNLVKKSGMGDGEIIELLKIANSYLPSVRLEYDRIKEEINSWKAAVSNAARTYQQFCDRNLALKNREDEFQRNIDEMENKKAELQKTTTELQQHLADLQGNNVYNDNLKLEIKQEEDFFTNDVFMPPSNMVIDYYQNSLNR